FRPAEFDGKPGPIEIETVIHFRHAVAESQPAESEPAESQPAASQPTATSSLEGTIKERGTRRNLAGVAVALRELGRETETDRAARFRIDAIPAGSYHLVAVASGFDRLIEGVTVAEGEHSEVVVYLRPSGGNPYETVVEGEREKLEVTRRTMTRRELTSVPG